jgi:hypothetical protein
MSRPVTHPFWEVDIATESDAEIVQGIKADILTPSGSEQTTSFAVISACVKSTSVPPD